MVLLQTYRIKMHQSVRVIFNLRAQVVLPLWQSWSKLTVFCFFLRCEFVWQAVSSLHSLWLFLISMHSSPYSLVTWWQISIGWTSFVLKNRITAWTSHAVVVSSGSSIADDCRAKIENFSRLSDGLLGKWERNKHGCVTTSHTNSFPAAPALWRPYFCDIPLYLCLHVQTVQIMRIYSFFPFQALVSLSARSYSQI